MSVLESLTSEDADFMASLAGAAMGAKATLDDTARHIDYLQQQVAAHPPRPGPGAP